MKNLLRTGLLLLCGMILLAACGQSNQTGMDQMQMGQMAMSPTRASTSSTGMNQMQMGQVPASPTQASTSATAVKPTHSATEQPVAVQITLTDFHVTSSRLSFQQGIPYHFTVINQGKVAHELMLMSTAMKTMNMTGMPMQNRDQMALATVNTINPAETKTFDYAFDVAATGLHPELSCHLPGHYEAGMYLSLTVSR